MAFDDQTKLKISEYFDYLFGFGNNKSAFQQQPQKH